jgi:hypothetical protein
MNLWRKRNAAVAEFASRQDPDPGFGIFCNFYKGFRMASSILTSCHKKNNAEIIPL